MDKPDLARMERQPSGGIGSRPVFQIADNGMAQNRQLNADLVLASGFERKLQQRLIRISLKYAIVRNCRPAAVVDPMNLECPAFHQIVFERSMRIRG